MALPEDASPAAEKLDESESESDLDDNSGYKSAEGIANPHFHNRTVGDLVEMIKGPNLDLNPSYQRDVVWASERMSKLIDSLLCNYYVPPLIFNVIEVAVDQNGAKMYLRRSIDGKQRLSSIREFVAGKIPCHDANGKNWWFCADPEAKPGAIRKILPAVEKRKFLQTGIVCVEYSALEQHQEEDLFSRVQLGVPLTPAEKLRASSGAWQDFAIELGAEFNKLIDIVVDDRRARGFQLILQVCKQLLKGDANDPEPKYSAGAASLKGFCSDTTFLTDEFKDNARSVFRRYWEVQQKFPETFKNQNYGHATKFSPVEFVGVAVLIHRFPNRNARLLSGDILELRRALRSKRQDLRGNTDTWRALVESILSIEESRGAVEPFTPNRIFGSAEEGAISFAAAPPVVGSSIAAISATGAAPSASQRARPPNKTQTESTPIPARPAVSARPPVSARPTVSARPPASARPAVSARPPVSARPAVSVHTPVSALPPVSTRTPQVQSQSTASSRRRALREEQKQKLQRLRQEHRQDLQQQHALQAPQQQLPQAQWQAQQQLQAQQQQAQQWQAQLQAQQQLAQQQQWPTTHPFYESASQEQDRYTYNNADTRNQHESRYRMAQTSNHKRARPEKEGWENEQCTLIKKEKH